MQPLTSSDFSKSFGMAPAAGHRRGILPSFHRTPAPFISLRFRLLILLLFPSLFLLILLSATCFADTNTFQIDYLPVLALSSGLVLLLRILLLCFRLLPRPSTLPLLLSIKRFSSWCRADRRTGLAVQEHSNGDVYEGELRRGKRHGSGVYYYASGKYEGDWIDSKYDGHGAESTMGSIYRGQYKKGLRHGFGVCQYHASGELYAGEWMNGQSHGYGEQAYRDGSRYVGEFRQGLKHGLGHYQFRNGDTYAGDYLAGNMHGFGVYRSGDGQCYEGEWHGGKRQGLGMCSLPNGEFQLGRWANSALEIHLTPNSWEGSSFAVNHARVLCAVQIAKTAAENAYNVHPRVGGGVNKAVAEADNAAKQAAVAGSNAVQTEKRGHGVELVRDFLMQIV